MKKATAFLLVIGLFSFAVLSYAADREDAKALVKRAAAYVSIRGKTRRWQRSARPRGCLTRVNFMYSRTIFRVSCLPTLRIRHLIGQNLIAVPDTEGKLFRKEIVEKAKSQGSGWVDYVYLNPETNKQEHKTTYFQKVGDIILCCGVYQDYSHEGD